MVRRTYSQTWRTCSPQVTLQPFQGSQSWRSEPISSPRAGPGPGRSLLRDRHPKRSRLDSPAERTCLPEQPAASANKDVTPHHPAEPCAPPVAPWPWSAPGLLDKESPHLLPGLHGWADHPPGKHRARLLQDAPRPVTRSCTSFPANRFTHSPASCAEPVLSSAGASL